jgi:glycosyltransferase involved in cell wall biosynthesis
VDVAVYHHLPTGGALRVLAEWARRTTAAQVTVYTPDASVHAFAELPARVSVRAVGEPGPYDGLGALVGLMRSIPAGRRAAEQIDAGVHDVVFALPNRLTQSPAILRHLRTPSVYYAPEALRVAYEDPRLIFPGDSVTIRLTRAGLNPVERLRRVLDRRAARAAPQVVTHSRFTQEDLRRNYGIDAEVLLLGVDLEAFVPAPARVDDADPYLLSVGALNPLKGHELVVEAVGRLPRERRPRLVVVGDRGHSGPALQQLATRLGVALELRSGVPFREVVALMQGATVVVAAQIREPFGLVPLEAMACARPVVAVDEGGLRESVRDERTGLLVPRDAAVLASALERLLGDPALRASFGVAGRAEVEQRWRWERYAREADRVLAEAAARR